MLNQMSWNGGALDVSKCVCNYDRTLLSIHRLRGCPNAAKQQLVKRYGPQVAHCLASGRGAKRGASLLQHPISTSFSFTLLDLITLSLYIKFTPSAQPPRRRKHQFLRWLLGSFKLIWMKFLNLRTDFFWEKGFFQMRLRRAHKLMHSLH